MEHYSLKQTATGLEFEGLPPDATKLVKISGQLADRLSHLALHQLDLRFALEAIETLNAPVTTSFLQDALWQCAIVHYFKCFGRGVRFSLNFDEIYALQPAEAKECFDYLKALRNKHIVHDVNAYAQALPGAALNDGHKAYKVEKITTATIRAVTLEATSLKNLFLLVTQALQWVDAQYDSVCKLITDELELLPYAALAALPAVEIKIPKPKEASTTRTKHAP